jgi:hypothetical protein
MTDFQHARVLLANGIRRAVEAYRREYPGEEFYRFELYCDDDATGVNMVAQTTAMCRQVAGEARTDPDKLATYTGLGVTDLDEWLKYAGPCSGHLQVAPLDEANEYFRQTRPDFNCDSDGFTDYAGHFYATMVHGMADADATGAFGLWSGVGVVLVCSFPGSVWFEAESVRYLNSPGVAAAFWSAVTQGAWYAEEYAAATSDGGAKYKAFRKYLGAGRSAEPRAAANPGRP